VRRRDARTVLAALTIERLNQDIFTCVELLHRENQTHLSLAGVEEIVVPDEYAGKILATASRNRGVVAVLDELLTSDLGNNIYKAPAPVEWFGKDVGWVMQRIKGEHDALFISLERSGSKGDKPRVLVNPPLQEKVEKGDYLIFLARSLPGSLN